MFLACENLEDRGAVPPANAAARPSNDALAADFRQMADILPRLRPGVTDADVAKIIELLADRDLAAGATEVRP